MSWMRKIGAGDLGAGAKRIGFVSGFLTVGAGQGRFKTGTVGLGAGTGGIGFISGFFTVGAERGNFV